MIAYLKALKGKLKKKKKVSKASQMNPTDFTAYRLQRMKAGTLSTSPKKKQVMNTK